MNNSTITYKRKGIILSIFLLALICLLLPVSKQQGAPYLLLLLGRFHPLVIHFPIVLIIVLGILEVGKSIKFFPVPDQVVTFTLLLSVISSILSVAAGYFLFASGDYTGDLVGNHFWSGTLTTAALCVSAGLYLLRIHRGYYLSILVVAIIGVSVTGHLGGLLTHGKGYLTEYLPFIIHDDRLRQIKPESEMLFYEDMVAPILQSKCVSCHNEDKKKGGLLMTTYDGLLKGGESGKATLTPSSLEDSELYYRVTLPTDHDDHMPPEGKSPLTSGEKLMLKYWISQDASPLLKVVEARQDSIIGPVIETMLPDLIRYQKINILQDIEKETIAKELKEVSKKIAVDIYESSGFGNEPYFTLAMKFPPALMTNDQFKLLRPYYEVFSKLSLVSSDIDDAGLYYISQMKNLKELYLQKTDLDGSGIRYFQRLQNLEVLNLSFTEVDDKSIVDLLKIPNLKTVYLFGTNTSIEVIEALRKNRPEMNILLEEGPYF